MKIRVYPSDPLLKKITINVSFMSLRTGTNNFKNQLNNIFREISSFVVIFVTFSQRKFKKYTTDHAKKPDHKFFPKFIDKIKATDKDKLASLLSFDTKKYTIYTMREK